MKEVLAKKTKTSTGEQKIFRGIVENITKREGGHWRY